MRVDEQIPKEYHQAIIKYLTSNSIFNDAKYDEKKQMFVHKYAFFYTPVSEKEVNVAWNWVLNEKAKEENGTTEVKEFDSEKYMVWGFVVGVPVFLGIWIYAISSWGLLLGLMFGWIPALIAGYICGLLWPLIALILGIVLLYLIYIYSHH